MVEGGTGTAVLGFPCVCGIPLLQGSGCARNSFRLGNSVHAGTLGWFPSPHGFRLTEVYFSYQKFYVIKEMFQMVRKQLGKLQIFKSTLWFVSLKAVIYFWWLGEMELNVILSVEWSESGGESS